MQPLPTNDTTLVLGIDGGGTKTLAVLAEVSGDGKPLEVGRGIAGPSNIRAVSAEAGFAALRTAITAAFVQSGRVSQTVDCIMLAMAGAGDAAVRDKILHWCGSQSLASRSVVVHDAWPVLRAGTPEGLGVALISGTGCVAFGSADASRTARAGGWGYLFGDEGSGFDVGASALRAITWAEDGRAGPTMLTAAALEMMHCASVQALATRIYQNDDPRTAVAQLARMVPVCAQAGDAVALEIVQRMARQWRRLLEAVVTAIAWNRDVPVPVALAGGVMTDFPNARAELTRALEPSEWQFAPVETVDTPAWGAVLLACDQASTS